MTREIKASVSRRQNAHAILKAHGPACVARGRVVQRGRMSMRRLLCTVVAEQIDHLDAGRACRCNAGSIAGHAVRRQLRHEDDAGDENAKHLHRDAT